MGEVDVSDKVIVEATNFLRSLYGDVYHKADAMELNGPSGGCTTALKP